MTATHGPGSLARLRHRALLVGAVTFVPALVLAWASPLEALRSYLTGYVFWLEIALGSLSILFLHGLTGGAWGNVIRAPLAAAARTLPLLALLFLPVAIGARHLYPWAGASGAQGAVAHPAESPPSPATGAPAASVAEAGGAVGGASADEAEGGRAPARHSHRERYLNLPFFHVRAAIYFAFWIASALAIGRWMRRETETGKAVVAPRLAVYGGPGLIVYGFTVTFAAIDWMMSLEPHWSSTVYGLIVMVGATLAALAFAVVGLDRLARRPPLDAAVGPPQFHDLGNLCLTFVVLWAYVGFAQLLIIWSANLREEVPWYVSRLGPGWAGLALLLVVGHFALPFAFLLSRPFKRRGTSLARLAIAILVLRWLDLHWRIAPAFHPAGFHLGPLDLLLTLGLGGLWLASYLGHLAALPLVPPDAHAELEPEGKAILTGQAPA